MTQKVLFEEELTNNTPVFKRFLPICTKIDNISNLWDIPYTIKELSYLVHSHYRYYGKFPPAVAGQILEELQPPSKDHYVLDNFCGSGTTLVEAKLRGINSYGIDISWLSVLVSNIKTSVVDINKIKSLLDNLIKDFNNINLNIGTPNDDFVNKWFENKNIEDLSKIQNYIYSLKKGIEKDFLLVAFISIIRRTSKAHDGEVRPHINKNKKDRDVLSAFSKKVLDMCKDHSEFLKIIDKSVISKCFLSNNLDLPNRFKDKKCYLAISHPPYLNSFNYSPVYSLEFYWGKVFEEEYTKNKVFLHKKELKAHPANEKITQSYFEHLKECYQEIYNIQEEGSFLAVVIGDCTRQKKLIPVINILIERVKEIGYSLHKINYRTTHYGLGKYAYNHRADYHGEEEEKKDAIIIFKK